MSFIQLSVLIKTCSEYNVFIVYTSKKTAFLAKRAYVLFIFYEHRSAEFAIRLRNFRDFVARPMVACYPKERKNSVSESSFTSIVNYELKISPLNEFLPPCDNASCKLAYIAAAEFGNSAAAKGDKNLSSCFPLAFLLLSSCFPLAFLLLSSCYPLATLLLPSCYPLATPLLPSCYPLAIDLLPSTFPLPCIYLGRSLDVPWTFLAAILYLPKEQFVFKLSLINPELSILNFELREF